jgi:CheY-like chemotaxis protein
VAVRWCDPVSVRKRIVVVDDDAYILRVVESALRRDGFDVSGYSDPRDALAGMRDVPVPDLILCDVLMPFMDGRALFREVKETAKLKDIPFVFISGVDSNDDIVETLERGADDFLSKPFNVSRLVAKVRATLRLAERRHDALSGPIGPGGTLPLLKFCEDSRLSGRLAVRSGADARWADFLGGELVLAGGAPEVAGEDPLDLLLAMDSGTYRIEQRRLDPEALHRSETKATEDRPAAEAPSATVPVPQGRLSMIRVRGQDIQVQTEGENRPEFTVTTVVAREGQVMRKVQSAWHHPFKRREDHDVARAQIDRQHDRVLAMLQGLSADTVPVPVPTAPAAALGVDPSLLAWALSFVAEQVRDQLGAVMTLAQLRGSYRRVAPRRPAVRSFRVAEDGRVIPAPKTEGTLPPAAVEAVAAWTAEFLSSAGQLDRAGGIRLRQATGMMEAELEKVGFYAAFDAVVAAGLTPPR